MNPKLAIILIAFFTLVLTALFAKMLYRLMLAKNAQIDYYTRMSQEMPSPPPRPPKKGASPEEAAAYFKEAAAWNERFDAYCAKYPA
jgi:hypothetical protein